MTNKKFFGFTGAGRGPLKNSRGGRGDTEGPVIRGRAGRGKERTGRGGAGDIQEKLATGIGEAGCWIARDGARGVTKIDAPHISGE
jgi:hypothetical protein